MISGRPHYIPHFTPFYPPIFLNLPSQLPLISGVDFIPNGTRVPYLPDGSVIISGIPVCYFCTTTKAQWSYGSTKSNKKIRKKYCTYITPLIGTLYPFCLHWYLLVLLIIFPNTSCSLCIFFTGKVRSGRRSRFVEQQTIYFLIPGLPILPPPPHNVKVTGRWEK